MYVTLLSFWCVVFTTTTIFEVVVSRENDLKDDLLDITTDTTKHVHPDEKASNESGLENGHEGSHEKSTNPKLEDQYKAPYTNSPSEMENILKYFRVMNQQIEELNAKQTSYASILSRLGFLSKSPVGVYYNQIHHGNGTFKQKNNPIPKDCKDVQNRVSNVSGIYEIQPRLSKNLLDFFLDWREYKFGFGDLNGEFWLGLENIHSLTASARNELLVELTDKDQKKAYAHYKTFKIGSEPNGYQLSVVTGYSGDLGDSMTYHLGMKFSTKDYDQDGSEVHCAEKYMGAWWYNSCFGSSLNGKLINRDGEDEYLFTGVHWNTKYSYSATRMLVRPSS
ncbi:hypothetical protein JTB14_001641 [Gonioctena quinquepunctata]|nr:hypothetical protein JTB14_001641 [Gonioctena quinquepunctata]